MKRLISSEEQDKLKEKKKCEALKQKKWNQLSANDKDVILKALAKINGLVATKD